MGDYLAEQRMIEEGERRIKKRAGDMPKHFDIAHDNGLYMFADPANATIPTTKYIRADLIPQWQPIETAPRDRRYILLYSPFMPRPIRQGKRHRYKNEWALCGGAVWYENEPTHWMPLPTPPEKDD